MPLTPKPSTNSLGIVGIVSLVFAAVVVHTDLTSNKHLFPSIAVGLAASAVWAGVFIGWRTMWARDQVGALRTVLGPTALLMLLAWIGLFAWSIPRDGPSHIDSRLGIATFTFGAGATLTLTLLTAALLPSNIASVTSEPRHRAGDRTEVWHVTGKNLDYYLARCDCEWVGETREGANAGPLQAAQHDAVAHNPQADIAAVEISA